MHIASTPALEQAVRGTTIGLEWLLIGMACFVLLEYSRNIRVGGALTRHVVLISTSYVMLLVATSFGQIARFYTPLTWRNLLILSAVILGIAALVTLLSSIRRRQLEAVQHDHVRREGDARRP